MRLSFFYVTVPVLLLVASCQKPLAANYSTREEASKQCLVQAVSWLKEELSKPPYDGTNAGSGFSVLKNSKGEYKVLDVYCKPLIKKDLGVGILAPYVRYMRMPETDLELHETQDVIAGSNFLDFSFPLDRSSR